MKTDNRTLRRKAAETAVIAAAMICFCFLAGDDTPEAPMSTTAWVSVKLMAAAALAAVGLTIRFLHRRGFFPLPE